MSDTTEVTQEMIDEFVVAAHHDLPKVQQMLAEHPALLNENATWVETGLGAASHVADRPIAEFLLEQGAMLDICAAAMLGRSDDVVALVQENPDAVNATGPHNIPLLFHAVIGGHEGIVRYLIENGADVNAGAGIQTALHGAAGFGHADLVTYLLRQGADDFAEDSQGRTPLDVAEQTGHEEIAALLRALREGGADLTGREAQA